MADIKIEGLDPITDQSPTDLYEISLDGAGSRKETRQQQITYLEDKFIAQGGSGSVDQLDANVINVNDKLNLIDYSDTMSYVSTSGDVTNNGQVIQAKRNIEDSIGLNSGDQLNVTPGTFTYTGNFSMAPFITIRGQGYLNTIYDVTGNIGLNDSTWTSSSNPEFTIRDITLIASGTINFTPTSVISGSTQRFYNVNHLSAATYGNLTNLNIDGCIYGDITISDVLNCNIKNTLITNGITININSTNNIYTFENVDFNNQTVNVVISGPYDPIFNFINCKNNVVFNYDDSSFGYAAIANFDFPSWPLNGYQDFGGQLIAKQTTEWPLVDTTRGFGNSYQGGNNFFWNQTNSIFAAGLNAHTVLGTNQTLLGKSTSSKSHVFVAAEATNSDFFPAQDNQFVVRYLNGFGFGTGDPKANFHVKASNSGSMLFSASSLVADADISNSELNPYITTTNLIFKGKYSGGGVFNYNLNSLPGYPLLATNNVFAGQNTFVSPIVQNSVVISLTGNSGTISAAQLTAGVLTFATTANASWALPTAAQMDSQLGAPLAGGGMRGIELRNPNNFTLTITAGTNFNLGLMSIAGTLVIPANTSVTVGFTRVDATPTYSLYGNSNNPQGSGDVTKAGDNVFTGQNTFMSYSLNNVTPVTLTANGGTLTVGQLFFGNTQFIPTADCTWTLPTQTSIDGALIGGSPGFGIGFDNIMFTNSSNFTVTFVAGTGTNFNGMSSPGILILGPGASVTLKITKDNTPAYVYSGASFGSGSYAIFNVTGSSKTLGLIDSNSLQNCNSATAQTITFPLNSSVAFPIGTRIDGAQIGAGQTTLAATGGVTLQSQLGNLKTAFQYAAWTATKTATDTWLIVGNLST
jgi:hypothetical protein